MTSITKTLSSIVISIFVCVAASQAAFADSYKVAGLEIKHPHAKAPLTKARVTGGYLTIDNNGSTDDRLVAVKVDFAKKTEIHEMIMDGDVMKMRELEYGIAIPAGKSATLISGGNHVMFMGLKEELKDGDKRKAILVFEKAGEVEVSFSIESLMKIKERDSKNATKKMNMKHDEMKHGDMKSNDMKHDEMKSKEMKKMKQN